MDRNEYEQLYALEESYWWFVGQRALLQEFFTDYYPGRRDLRVMDIGPGTGINMQFMQRFGAVHGIDISSDSIEFCKRRGLDRLTKSNAMQIAFAGGTFDAVTSLGVFYHSAITDDLAGFREIYRVLKPGGHYFIFDCAMEVLRSKHDEAYHGGRRYSKRGLQGKLESAGFALAEISYVNSLLFPVAFVRRKLGQLSSAPPASDLDQELAPSVNALLQKLYLAELRLRKRIPYPFGVNIVAIARKSAQS